jgi:cytoskeletal protein RodZ
MTDRAEPAGVGARLKRTREGKRVTLRQIANTTKISVSALDAIERDDVRKLPGGIFARSFVRAYASELGLDPERAVQEFFAQFPEVVEAPPSSIPLEEDEGSMFERLPVGALRVAAVAAPTILLIMWMLLGGRGGAPANETPLTADRIAAARPDVPLPVTDRRPTDIIPAGGALPVEPPAPASALTLHVTARRECWVSVTADGREVVSRLMSAGEEEAVRAGSELRLKVGDAAAVALRLNGSPVRPLGVSGQVVTLRIDAANMRDLIQTP